MSSRLTTSHVTHAVIAFSVSAASILFVVPIIGRAQDQSSSNDDSRRRRFEVTSSTFSDGETLPLSMVFDQCQPRPGANQSPELSWTNAPRRTQSFAVVMYDVTASFTHWGMYNIDSATTELPENAGVPNSPFGLQVGNDFGRRTNLHYDGPCPPTTLKPPLHQYVFTVYALDTTLTLPTFPDFPPGAEALFQALISPGRRGHVLASASISGFFTEE